MAFPINKWILLGSIVPLGAAAYFSISYFGLLDSQETLDSTPSKNDPKVPKVNHNTQPQHPTTTVSETVSLTTTSVATPSKPKPRSTTALEQLRTQKGGVISAGGWFIENKDLEGSDYLGSLVEEPSYSDTGSYPTPNAEEALDIIQILKDHTMFFHNDSTGFTAWILDYEIPSNGNYPLKWFLGTSAHFLHSVKFADDKYSQQANTNGDDKLLLKLRKDTGSQVLDRDMRLANDEYLNEQRIYNHHFRSVHVVHKPNISLFYLPTNYLGNRYMEDLNGQVVQVDYVQDFAILEINFKDETEAQIMTNYLYDKHKNGSNYKKLKFFSHVDLSANKSYFFGGHSSDALDLHSFISNYSRKQNKGSKFTGYDSGTYSVGFDVKGKHHKLWGRRYMFDNYHGRGSSGSLVVDEDLNVVGVMNAGVAAQRSYVDPVRWKGTYEIDASTQEKKILTPKYDLILGAKGQKGSYREQLQQHYPDINTYLKSEWTKLSEHQTN